MGSQRPGIGERPLTQGWCVSVVEQPIVSSSTRDSNTSNSRRSRHFGRQRFLVRSPQAQQIQAENTTDKHDHREPEEVEPERKSQRQANESDEDGSSLTEGDLPRAIVRPPEPVLLSHRASGELPSPHDQGETAYCGHDPENGVVHILVIRLSRSGVTADQIARRGYLTFRPPVMYGPWRSQV